MTLIEVLLAMGIIAAVAVIFLAGMSTSSNVVIMTSENITAESLAKSQMEYAKRLPYDSYATEYPKLDAADIPAGYDIRVEVQLMNPRGDSEVNDDGLQKIIVIVTHNGVDVHRLEGYKVFTGQ